MKPTGGKVKMKMVQVPLKSILFETVSLLMLAVIAGFVVNYLSPEGIAWMGNWDPSKHVISANPKNHKLDYSLEIADIQIIKKIYDRSQALFVDARPQAAYAEGHIKGAVSLPLYEIDGLIESFEEDYDLDRFIITYCSGRECSDSHELAQYLKECGYKQVHVFIDGFPNWEENGYPVE